MHYFWTVWNILRNFFGNVFLIFVIIGLILVLVEAISYRRGGAGRRKKGNHTGRDGVTAGKAAAENAASKGSAGSVDAASSDGEVPVGGSAFADGKVPVGGSVFADGEVSAGGSAFADDAAFTDRTACEGPASGESTGEEQASEEPKETPAFRKRIALITGASSGMGAEFAKRVDETEKGIAEIWLIARRKERLDEVAEKLHHKTKVLPMDLLDTQNFPLLEETLQQEEAQVGLFINCAGYAKIGNYARVSREESERLVDLNCRAAVDCTVTVLPFMQAGDRIIEICSTAAFQPLQHFNIYAAAKSFLYYYCRALRLELLPRKIAVTAVCPYWVRDTEFISVARDGEQKKEGQSAIKSFPLSTTRSRVVRRAMRTSRQGFAVSTPGIVCFLHRIFSKVISKESLLYMWEGIRRV